MDPIFAEIGNVFRRTFVFIGLTAAQALVLWLWFWLTFKDAGVLEALFWIADALPLTLSNYTSVVLLACLWIGLANSSVLYLLIARWWHKRADVLHRRGTHFVDEREGS